MGRQNQTLFRKPQYEALFVTDNLPFDAGVSTSSPLYEGDLTYWTGTGIAPLSGGALSAANVLQLAAFLGVNGEADPSTYWNNRAPDSGRVYNRGFADLYQTAADVYHQWDEVTVGADAQTVTKLTTAAGGGPDSSPAGLWTGTGTSGLFTAAAHKVTATYITAAGETTPGTAATVTLSATQGFNYDYDNASAYVIPAWAQGVAIYIDGIYATTFWSAPGSDQVINNYATGSARIAPVSNALAIGRVMLSESMSVGNAALKTSITGVAGNFIRVKFRSKYPDLGQF